MAALAAATLPAGAAAAQSRPAGAPVAAIPTIVVDSILAFPRPDSTRSCRRYTLEGYTAGYGTEGDDVHTYEIVVERSPRRTHEIVLQVRQDGHLSGIIARVETDLADLPRRDMRLIGLRFPLDRRKPPVVVAMRNQGDGGSRPWPGLPEAYALAMATRLITPVLLQCLYPAETARHPLSDPGARAPRGATAADTAAFERLIAQLDPRGVESCRVLGRPIEDRYDPPWRPVEFAMRETAERQWSISIELDSLQNGRAANIIERLKTSGSPQQWAAHFNLRQGGRVHFSSGENETVVAPEVNWDRVRAAIDALAGVVRAGRCTRR